MACSYGMISPRPTHLHFPRYEVRFPRFPLKTENTISQTNLVETFCPRLAPSGLDKKFEQAASNARLTVAPWKKVGFVGWLLCSPLPLLGGAILFFLFPDIAAS